MTIRNRRTKRDAEIKQYLLRGYTLASIAKFTKISPTRVGQIRNLLLESGELVKIPDTNPRVYVDPHAHALGSELLENDGSVETNGLTRDGPQARDVSYIRDSLPPNGRLPMGMVNAHISGRISMTVRKKGDFKDIQGTNDLYIGYWETESSGGKGKIHRGGTPQTLQTGPDRELLRIDERDDGVLRQPWPCVLSPIQGQEATGHRLHHREMPVHGIHVTCERMAAHRSPTSCEVSTAPWEGERSVGHVDTATLS